MGSACSCHFLQTPGMIGVVSLGPVGDGAGDVAWHRAQLPTLGLPRYDPHRISSLLAQSTEGYQLDAQLADPLFCPRVT